MPGRRQCAVLSKRHITSRSRTTNVRSRQSFHRNQTKPFWVHPGLELGLLFAKKYEVDVRYGHEGNYFKQLQESAKPGNVFKRARDPLEPGDCPSMPSGQINPNYRFCICMWFALTEGLLSRPSSSPPPTSNIKELTTE